LQLDLSTFPIVPPKAFSQEQLMIVQEEEELAASKATMDLAKSYLASIKRESETGSATEHTYRAALKAFMEGLDRDVVAINEPKREACGAPDFVVRKGDLSTGYIEAKDIGKSLDEAEDSEQLKRYRKSLHNLILTDYLEFRWYVYDELRKTARIGRVGKNNKIIISDHESISDVLSLLDNFLNQTPEKITTPIVLANQLARIAIIIRDIVIQSFEKNIISAELQDLRGAIASVLIPEIGQPDRIGEFADMYAQTIVYGLFAARCNHHGSSPFKRSGAASEIPKTNPFLRKLFASITGLGMEEEPHAPFIDDLVQILNSTDIDAVLANFGKRNKQEDPVIHFYETFLKAYDPGLRELRGVYYTPEPVVSYIVRSVDQILKKQFDLSGGLLDTSETEYEREKYVTDYRGMPEDHQLPTTVNVTCPKVLILDPACGTGTFLYNIVDYIRRSYMETMGAGYWSLYVRDKLLKRIFGFELLMASYAVAHFKLGMQLSGRDLPEDQQDFWRYDFASNERLGIFLTNTLQEAENIWHTLFLRTITEEATEASVVKKDMPIMVVLGNPPYSGHSANSSWEIVKGKRRLNFIGQLLNDYYYVDGKPLGEKNPKWLQDDYVKFIRWGQWRIERTGAGVLAFITNNGYLDNPTFRGMRQQLMDTFDEIYILNLHGNSKKKERAPDGSPDENVFEIQQGVSIGIFIKKPKKSRPLILYYADIWGIREDKYRTLFEKDISTTTWQQLQPEAPFYLFVPYESNLRLEFDRFISISKIFQKILLGPNSHRDHFAVAFNYEDAVERIADLSNPSKTDEEIRQKYLLKDNRDWSLTKARKNALDAALLVECIYRPFDYRYMLYGPFAFDYHRPEINDNLLKRNFALISTKQTKEPFSALVTNKPAGQHKLATPYDGSYLSPLYIYPNGKESNTRQGNLTNVHSWPHGKDGRIPNLNPEFVLDLESSLGLKFVSDGRGDLDATFGPEDIFDYIYSILYSSTYRKRYSEFLKMDFPRVPLISNIELFRMLCTLGEELVSLHLLESSKLELSRLPTRYPIKGDNIVEKGYPKYIVNEEGDSGYVYINKTQYLEGVPKDIWEFQVGGYQVCEKWLKDRRGRQLSYDDITHYRRIVAALMETIRLMEEIDKTIQEWPIK